MIGGANDWNLNLFEYNTRSDVKIFLDCLISIGFFPTITIPTHISTIPPFSQTLIDNIFTNTLSSILQSCTICCGIADHQAVFCCTNILDPRPQVDKAQAVKRFNFSRIEELKINIARNLCDFAKIDNPEQACNTLISSIQHEVNHLSSTSTHRRTTPIQPWVTFAILRSMNTRNRLLKEFLKNRSIENESKFKRYRNILRLTLRQAKKQYFQNQFSKHVNNPRLLWENLLEAIQKQKAKPKPASRFEINGDFITDEKLIAE